MATGCVVELFDKSVGFVENVNRIKALGTPSNKGVQ
jgi:hypothetical protein